MITKDQIAELEAITKKWLNENNINSNGLVITIDILPVQVIISPPVPPTASRARKFIIRELSEDEWKAIFDAASLGNKPTDILKNLAILKARNNRGLTQGDFPGKPNTEGGYLFKTKLNALFYRSKSAYRVVHPHGHCWEGPYQIGVRR